MARFWAALHDDRIVGPEWRERFLAPHVSTPTPGYSHGLGVWIHQRPAGPRTHLLEGADAGVTFTSLKAFDRGIEYVVACNAPPGASEIVALLDEAVGVEQA